jgi:crotonobetainyl-CoA:carnitine CoA-transferase CaiB-like acyl-CoA transferase
VAADRARGRHQRSRELPQLTARDYWQRVEHPDIGRTVTYPGASRASAARRWSPARPPLIGEHNQEVAAEIRDRGLVVAGGATGGAASPLAGLKVADFMWVAAGPWAIRYLVDFGATVVRVESSKRIDHPHDRSVQGRDPGPGTQRRPCDDERREARLSLDLSSEEGRRVARKLCDWADVVTESFTPGAMAKIGLDYETIRQTNPGVIMISSCLNGQTGPYAHLAGFGTMGAQIAGFGDLAGWPDRAPAGPAGAYTDYLAPKFEAAAILAALEHRRRTGEGQYIDSHRRRPRPTSSPPPS